MQGVGLMAVGREMMMSDLLAGNNVGSVANASSTLSLPEAFDEEGSSARPSCSVSLIKSTSA
jgi:hypothetical protein